MVGNNEQSNFSWMGSGLMVVLLTGGAGYIGSHTARQLVLQGFQVVIYDNLSCGHREAVNGMPLVVGDIAETEKLSETIMKYKVDAVIHFAANSLVGESVENPQKYFINNVMKGIGFLNQLLKDKVKYLVFSSSAAVYGDPLTTPINEEHILQPTNTYGDTKNILEKVMQRYHQAYGLRYISLRYFNAAGADTKGDIGEDHNPETHLIPIILQSALGKKVKVKVFGDDYNTPDGTAIRDYVHVNDLAEAHILALRGLSSGQPRGVYNLGSEHGFSVLEVIKTASTVIKENINHEIGSRRIGDPAVLVASSEKIKRELGWQPQFSSLSYIINSAWKWYQGNSKGYF